MNIELAQLTDIKVINGLIESAKRFWGYSDELMDIWLPDLLLKPDDFNSRTLWVMKLENKIVAVSSLIFSSEDSCELEDFWISPCEIGKGFGRQLFSICP
jgi:N-acetylglutamate synthase-like GNAT family acetyltransferase